MSAIEMIAELPDGVGKHAAFMRFLGFTYFEIACAARRFEGEPLTAESMRYITAHWDDDEATQ